MIIKSLKASNLRNLGDIVIKPHKGLNYLYGRNGAGKTSVLESIVVLSRGRSFRTSQAQDLVGPKGKTFHVFAEICNHDNSVMRLGLERSGKRWRGRIDGQDLSQLSQLTRRLPAVMMEPDSHQLISGSPETRRKYLDWGMFHVEHGFLNVWRNYSKALKQRNAALRKGENAIIDSIDEVLAQHGTELGRMREEFADRVSGRIGFMMQRISKSAPPISLEYQPGWKGNSYLGALKNNRQRDLERGMTQIGPHRAELALSSGKQAARAVLSRGEQKALAAAMLLSQAEILVNTGEKPVLLLDDLVSEFDRGHFRRVMDTAMSLDTQVWLSGTEKPDLEVPHKMFHVKQGQVKELV